MKRYRILRLAVPFASGAAVAVIGRSGALDLPLLIGVLGGGLLGWSVLLAIESTLLLGGRLSGSAGVSSRRLQQLERDKLLLLRAIKEIEFDAAVQRVDPAEARELAAPLYQRAMRLLRAIDEARQERPATPMEAIEREVARRRTEGEG